MERPRASEGQTTYSNGKGDKPLSGTPVFKGIQKSWPKELGARNLMSKSINSFIRKLKRDTYIKREGQGDIEINQIISVQTTKNGC